MSKYPNKYGFEPRSQREADDLDAEAEHWKQKAASGEKGGNCFVVLLGLVVFFASFTTILFT